MQATYPDSGFLFWMVLSACRRSARWRVFYFHYLSTISVMIFLLPTERFFHFINSLLYPKAAWKRLLAIRPTCTGLCFFQCCDVIYLFPVNNKEYFTLYFIKKHKNNIKLNISCKITIILEEVRTSAGRARTPRVPYKN